MKRWEFSVEILAGALGWVDITDDVRGDLSITRGRSGEGYRADPGQCGFRLDNRSGRYSPRNPASDLHGYIGKNTPIRVHAGPTGGTLVSRFYGEIPSWPPRWSLSGTDRYVDLDAAGVLRRFGQGDQPALSPMRRTIEGSQPVAYWPGEDGELSGQAGAATSGLAPLTVSGVVTFKPVEDYVNFGGSTTTFGTTALADLAAGGKLSAPLSGDATAGGPWTVHAAILVDTAALSADVVVLEWTTSGGTYTRWQIKVTTGLRTQLIGFTPAGVSTLLIDNGSASSDFHHYSASASVSGGTVTVRLQTSIGVNLTATFAGSLGGVTAVTANPTGATVSTAMPAGHVAVWAAAPIPIQTVTYLDGYGGIVQESRESNLGEAAVDRLIRLAAEAGLDVDVTPADPAHVSRMNIQLAASTTSAIDDAIAVDGGMLYEARDAGALVYRTRSELYNQTPVTVAYAGQTSPPFDPVDDVDDVRNDVTVERRNGSSARAVQRTGPLAAVVPPTGVGIYTTSDTLNVLDDTELADQAGWRLHLGTVDEPRYPAITVQLAAPDWVSAPTLRTQVLALDVGGVLEVTDPPAWVSGRVRTLVTGYSETIGEYTWSITFNGVPASPWDVATADGEQRAPADGSTLAVALTSSGTSLLLASTAENGLWGEDPADFPLDLRVGGEKVTASAIGPMVDDPLDAAVSNGWGTTPTGETWQVAVGTAANFSVSGGFARHSLPANDTPQVSLLPVTLAAFDVVFPARITTLATGDVLVAELAARWVNASNHYRFEAHFLTGGAIDLRVVRIVGGGRTVIGAASAVATYAANVSVWVRCKGDGSTLSMKAWGQSDPEPGTWHVTATDGTYSSGQVGVYSLAAGGNTNAKPVQILYGSFTVLNPQRVVSTRAVNGVARAWPAGTEVDVWQPAIAAL